MKNDIIINKDGQPEIRGDEEFILRAKNIIRNMIAEADKSAKEKFLNSIKGTFERTYERNVNIILKRWKKINSKEISKLGLSFKDRAEIAYLGDIETIRNFPDIYNEDDAAVEWERQESYT